MPASRPPRPDRVVPPTALVPAALQQLDELPLPPPELLTQRGIPRKRGQKKRDQRRIRQKRPSAQNQLGRRSTRRQPKRPRIACAAVPLFPLAARLRCEPELLEEGLAVLEGNGHMARVAAATRLAREAGVRIGMTLSQARAPHAQAGRPRARRRVRA